MLHTVGFTRHSAEHFFGLIGSAGVRRVIDVRRRNDSTLCGFSRRRDLPWLLDRLCGAEYIHLPLLSPSAELLDAYRGRLLTWDEYARRFVAQLERRQVLEYLPGNIWNDAVLLCSEHGPERCHRRLVAELLLGRCPELQVVHLK